MTLGKLWLTLILMALLALGAACGQTAAPTPTVQPTPTATVTPTATPTPTPTATPYPFPEQTRAIGKLEPDDPVAFGSEPFLLSGCYAGRSAGDRRGLPAFSSTGLMYGTIALVKGIKIPFNDLQRGNCYQIAVTYNPYLSNLSYYRPSSRQKFRTLSFDAIHPEAWHKDGISPSFRPSETAAGSK